MLKMVDGTGIIGVDMICPLGVSAPQPPNYDRVELEGTGMLVLPNSLDAPLERLELGGKTEGKKQVIPVGEIEQGTVTAYAGNNYPSDYRVRTKSYINLTSGVYEVMCTGAKLGNVIFYSAENKYEKMLSETHIPLPIKFTLEENKTVRILFSNSESTPIAPTDIKNAILEADVSPEHPQEIVNSGKWNEETQKYEVDVKVVGKNLFDVNYFTKNENYQNKDGDATYWKYTTFKVKPNTTYTVSKRKSLNVNGAINNGIYYGGALAFNNDVNSVKITTKDDGVFYVIFFYRSEDVNILKEMDIQIELGETLTEYEPYKEQTLTLTSDRPITKWDKLVEQGGQIGWLYKSKIESIPKTGWVLHAQGYFYRGGLFLDSVVNNVPKNEVNLFTHFRLGNPTIAENKDVAWLCVVALGNTSLRVRLADETITTASAFEKYIADKDIKIAYETTNPEFVPLPQSEQNAIRALKTYYPTTVITVDGGELDPDIKVTYRKEI